MKDADKICLNGLMSHFCPYNIFAPWWRKIRYFLLKSKLYCSLLAEKETKNLSQFYGLKTRKYYLFVFSVSVMAVEIRNINL